MRIQDFVRAEERKDERMPEIVGECIVFFLFVCFVFVRPRPQSHSVLFTDMRNNFQGGKT